MTDHDVQEDVDYDLEDFNVGPYKFVVTTIAFMPIEVLMAMGEKKVEISGQKLWCGSLGVIEYLLDHPVFVKDKIVLELGAGTGVLGMLCNRLGASKVVLTDNDPRSITHMTADVPRNNIDATVCSLDWFQPPSQDELVAMVGGRAATDAGAVRVVAGDVLYKRELLEPFMNTTKAVLTAFSGSEMILCHVPRAGIEQKDVVALAADKGLTVTEMNAELWRKGSCTEYSPEEDYSRARLYTLRA